MNKKGTNNKQQGRKRGNTCIQCGSNFYSVLDVVDGKQYTCTSCGRSYTRPLYLADRLKDEAISN